MQEFFSFVMTTWPWWILFALLLITIIYLEVQGSQVEGALSVQELTNLVNHDHAALVDLRPKSDFLTGNIVGSQAVPFESTEAFDQKFKKYKQRPVILICPDGTTSAKAAARLRKAGMAKIFLLSGGLRRWKSDSMPLISSS